MAEMVRLTDWITERPRAVDALVTTLSALFVLGAYLAAWNQVSPGSVRFALGDQAVLDAGWLLLTVFLGGIFLRNLRAGRRPNRGLPAGYGAALIACGVFGVAAVVEVTWQAMFGFGNGSEALLSPPHLAMATAGAVMVGGPRRAAAARGEEWASPT